MDEPKALKVIQNPRRNSQYFIIYRNEFFSDNGRVVIKLVFVPDGEILDEASYNIYLENIFGSGVKENSLEAIAAKIIEDLSNELIPYWISIRISLIYRHPRESGDDYSVLHKVVLEDKRPGWDNPMLLGRLKLL